MGAKLYRGQSGFLLEEYIKLFGLPEAEFVPNFRDGNIGVGNHFDSCCDSDMIDICHEGKAGFFVESTAEIVLGQMDSVCRLTQCNGSIILGNIPVKIVPLPRLCISVKTVTAQNQNQQLEILLCGLVLHGYRRKMSQNSCGSF